MLGKSVPNGNGRLALALVDSLFKRLAESGAISAADIAAVTAEAEARLTTEHSIAAEGALMVLRSSQFGH